MPSTSCTGPGLSKSLQHATCPDLRRAQVTNASASVAISIASSIPSTSAGAPPSMQYTAPDVVHAHVLACAATTPATCATPETSVGVFGKLRPQHVSVSPCVRTQAYAIPTAIRPRVNATGGG